MLTYNLKSSDGCFKEFHSIVVAVACIATAAQSHVSGKVDFKDGDIIALSCHHLSKNSVHFPLSKVVHAALHNLTPDVIQISIAQNNVPSPEYKYNTPGFLESVEAIFQGLFISYYERNYEEMKRTYPKLDLSGPSSWQMGWVGRNALSHNGCVYFRSASHPPVIWKGLELSPADNNKKVLHSILIVGDLIVMMLDMESDRPNSRLSKRTEWIEI